MIVMIPDGCSTEWLAFGRWMNQGLPLHLDAQIRGLVRTYCSDSPIGDSAPTGSTYATGHRSRDGYVATYPDRSMDKLGNRVATDPQMAFRPMFTIMEAAKKKGMKIGEVFTCHFTHATPADFLAHTPDRDQYARICRQMVCQAPDLMLGGGSFYIDSALNLAGFDALSEMDEKGIAYVKDFSSVKKADRQGASKIWGLFAPQDMAFEIDRPEEQPYQGGPGQGEQAFGDGNPQQGGEGGGVVQQGPEDAQQIQGGQQGGAAQEIAGEGLGQAVLSGGAQQQPGQGHPEHQPAQAAGIGQLPHQAHRQAEARPRPGPLQHGDGGGGQGE